MSLSRSLSKGKQLPSEVQWNSKKPRLHLTTTTILNLPDEILLKIFSLFSLEERYFTLSLVCNRWKNLTEDASLWQKIDTRLICLRPSPTKILLEWISVARLLRHLVVHTYYCINFNSVLTKVAKNCQQLHTLEVIVGQAQYGRAENGPYPNQNGAVKAEVMCNLIISCPKLSVFHFNYLDFNSCKFFELLLGNIKENDMRQCHFQGDVTFRQFTFILELILESVHLFEVDKYAQLLFEVISKWGIYERVRHRNYYRLKLDCENITKFLNTMSNSNLYNLCNRVCIIWNTNNNYCYNHLENIDYYTESFENVLK